MYENSYTLRTLGGLITNTYILAIIIAIVFVGISILIANMIAYEGGKNPRDSVKRRTLFFILGVIAAIAFFSWNYLYISSKIKGVPAQSKFMIHNGVSTGIVLVAFILIGLLLSKLLKKGKYGTIFPSRR